MTYEPSPRIDATLVQRLIAEQFPQWSNLPVRPVERSGWDNRSFRLGDDLVARLPSRAEYAAKIPLEQHWLPRLAPMLPRSIPEPVALGEPSAAYPWPWSIRRWIHGIDAASTPISDMPTLARDLALFLRALQSIDASGGPVPGGHNFQRGGPLAYYDGETRAALAALRGRIDTAAATCLWDDALAVRWTAEAVWLHGDVAAANLLLRDGALCAVIDFGGLAVGDPACDLAVAWTLFDPGSRQVFRDTLGPDDSMWLRGRGWALWKALIVLAAGDASDPRQIATSRRVLDSVFAVSEGAMR